MTLLEKAQEAFSRLTTINRKRETAGETEALEGIRVELLGYATPINQLAKRAVLLTKEGVSLSRVREIDTVVDNIKINSARFAETPKSTTLKHEKRWSGLVKKLEAINIKVNDAQKNDWQKHFDKSYFGGDTPAQLANRIAPTPNNRIALKRYGELFATYIKYKGQVPSDANEFKILRDISKQLSLLKFEENVPEDVAKFFAAISSGAGLDLLTLDVLEWLRKNKLLDKYVVRAKY